MTAIGSWVTQKAIVKAIRDSTAIMALVSNVYDSVPESAAFPFIVVGDGTETDASTFGQVAHLVTPEIQVWTRDNEGAPGDSGAAGFKVGLSIAELIVALLLNDAFTVDGHDTIVMPLEEIVKQRGVEGDGSVRLIAPKIPILIEDS